MKAVRLQFCSWVWMSASTFNEGFLLIYFQHHDVYPHIFANRADIRKGAPYPGLTGYMCVCVCPLWHMYVFLLRDERRLGVGGGGGWTDGGEGSDRLCMRMAGVLWTFCSLCPHSMASLQLAWQTRLQVLGLFQAPPPSSPSPSPPSLIPVDSTHPCPDSAVTPVLAKPPLPSTCSSVCTLGWAYRFYEASGGPLPSSGEPGGRHTHTHTHTHTHAHTQTHRERERGRERYTQNFWALNIGFNLNHLLTF